MQAGLALRKDFIVLGDFKILDINLATKVPRRELQKKQSYDGCFYLA